MSHYLTTFLKFFLLLFVIQMLGIQLSTAQVVTIYDNWGTEKLPANTSKNYSYSQQIYLNSQIQQQGIITSLSIKRKTNNDPLMQRNLTIYMGMTEKNSFESDSDWISVSQMIPVYSGIIPINGSDWTDIPLQTAFEYDSSFHLVIAFDDNTNSQAPTYFYAKRTGDVLRSLYFSDNVVNPNPQMPPVGTHDLIMGNMIPAVKLHFEQPISMSFDTLINCDFYYTDPQGIDYYVNNQSFTQTVYSSSMAMHELTIDFMNFHLAEGDSLFLYDGPNTQSMLIGMFTQDMSPGSYRANGLSLTFRFVSNSADTASGWLAHLYCVSCSPVSVIPGSPCASDDGFVAASPFCTDDNPQGIVFPSVVGNSSASSFFAGMDHVACLVTLLRPAWYYMQINNPGDLLIHIQQMSNSHYPLDVDFACWGPFQAGSQSDFMQRLCCGEYQLYNAPTPSHHPADSLNGNHSNELGGYPINNLIDCSSDRDYTEWCFIPNAQIGQFYILLITNFDGDEGSITFNANNYYSEATTDCNLLTQISSNGPICVGDTLKLFCESEYSNAEYLWSGPNNFYSNQPNPIIVNANESHSGVYTLITTLNSIQSEPISTTVMVNNYPNLTLTATDTVICLGNSTTLTATGAVQYYWSDNLPDNSAQTLFPDTTTTYSVLISNEGCSDMAEITIHVVPNPEVQLVLPSQSLCPNSNSILVHAMAESGTPSYHYSWSQNMISSLNGSDNYLNINNLFCDTVYTISVQVMDDNQCVATDTGFIFVVDTTPPILNHSISNLNAQFVHNQYLIPDFTNVVIPYVSDNCTSINELQITQFPTSGQIITQNTQVTIVITDLCGNQIVTTAFAIVPLRISFQSRNISCFGGDDGWINCMAVGGMPPYSYQWNSSLDDSLAIVDSLFMGTYTVTVSDAFSPQTVVSGSITLYQPLPISVTDIVVPRTCDNNNGSISLAASGGYPPYFYNWSNEMVGASIHQLTSGTYSCTITDATGCRIDSSFLVPEIPAPDISLAIPFDTVCPTIGDILLTADTFFVSQPAVYQWNGASVLPSDDLTASLNVNPLFCDSILYVVVSLMDNNNCFAADTASVMILDHESPNFQNFMTSYDAVLDHGHYLIPDFDNLLRIDAVDNCWNNSELIITQSIPSSTEIFYDTFVQVVVTDPCTNADTITVLVLVPLNSVISTRNISCYGGNDGRLVCSVFGGSPPYTYQWNSAPLQYSDTALDLHAGVYIVLITDSNGFSIQDSAIVFQPDSLEMLNIMVQPKCGLSNGSIQLQVEGGTPPYEYAWNEGSLASSLFNLSGGNYWCRITDDHGCVISDSFLLQPIPAPELTLALPWESVCLNVGTLDIVATEQNLLQPAIYQWSGVGVQQVNDTQTTMSINSSLCDTTIIIALSVIDSNGCELTVSDSLQIIDNQQPVIHYAPIPNFIQAQLSNNQCVIPDLTYIMDGVTDNCWSTENLQIIQNPLPNTMISENTIVRISAVDPCGNMVYVDVLVFVHLELATSLRHVSCFGYSDGQAICQVSGGTPPYSFVWNSNPPQYSDTARNLSAGVYSVIVNDLIGFCDTLTVEIVQPDSLFISETIDSTTCNLSNGSIALQMNGGTLPYQVLWNTGDTVADISHLAEGYYSVLLEDAHQCRRIDTFEIIAIPSPTLSLVVPPNVLCPNDGIVDIHVVTSNLTPNVSYTWTGLNVMNTLNDFSFIQIDSTWCDMTVTVIAGLSDENNCTIFDTAQISIHDEVAPTINLNIPAQQPDVVLQQYCVPNFIPLVNAQTIDNCWANERLQFLQTPLAGTPITTSQNVIVSVVDPCENESEVTISLVVPSPLVVTITAQNEVLCFGESTGSLLANAQGGTPPYNYTWNTVPQQLQSTITDLPAGNYTVTVTDFYGFTATASYTITQPAQVEIAAITRPSYCNLPNGSLSVTVSGGASPYAYHWSTGDSDNSLEMLSSGFYSVTITDAHHCEIIYNDTIQSIPSPELILLNVSAAMCHVDNGAVEVQTIGGTVPYHYSWSFSDNHDSPSAQNLNPGIYSVIVTDENSCRDTLVVTVDDFFVDAQLQETTPAFCERNNGTATVSATGGDGFFVYNWFGIADFEDNVASNLAPGSYYMTVTDLACIDTVFFEIDAIPSPVACFDISTNPPFMVDNAIQFENCSSFSDNWRWNFGDGVDVTTESPSFVYDKPGIYSVVLTVSNNYDCVDSVFQIIEIKERAYVYFPNAFTPNHDGKNELFKPVFYNISLEGYSLIIYNRWGNEVFYTKDMNNGWNGSVNGKMINTVSNFSYVVCYRDTFGKPYRISGSFTLIP